MLRVLLLFLACVSLFESGVVAAAVGTTSTTVGSTIPAATPSPVSNVAAAASDPSFNTCIYLDGCRSLYSIVQTCLLTIFACIWAAVHRNIPGPNQSWISVQLECLKVVVLTLLVPEWILAWAVRQWFTARRVTKELERARKEAQQLWEKKQGISVIAIQEDGGSAYAEIEGERDEGNIGDREGGSEVHLMHPRHSHANTNAAGAAGEDPAGTCASAVTRIQYRLFI